MMTFLLHVQTTRDRGFRVAFLLLLSLFLQPALLLAGDWPNIHGPNRDGIAVGETLFDTWPGRTPEERWRIRGGEGFGGLSIAGDTAILFHRVGGNQRVQALDPATGKTKWQRDYPTRYRGGLEPDGGSRTNPVIAGGRVFVYDPEGKLHALDLASGRKLWSRSLEKDTRAPEGYFGAGAHPMFGGGVIMVNVGGRDAGIAGLDPATGKTKWVATDQRASYASGVMRGRQAIWITRLSCVGLDAATGRIAWEIPFGMRGPTVNAAIPLVRDDKLFLTASYRVGGQLHDLSAGTPRKIWANDTSLSAQYNTPVWIDGYLYGTHGREDHGSGEFRCVEAATGKVMWTEPGSGMQFVIAAGDKLLLWKIDGTLSLAKANPKRFELLQRANITGNLSRSTPSLANGRLFVRATPGPVVCLQVGPSK